MTIIKYLEPYLKHLGHLVAKKLILMTICDLMGDAIYLEAAL